MEFIVTDSERELLKGDYKSMRGDKPENIENHYRHLLSDNSDRLHSDLAKLAARHIAKYVIEEL